jgi:hypothetical protein
MLINDTQLINIGKFVGLQIGEHVDFWTVFLTETQTNVISSSFAVSCRLLQKPIQIITAMPQAQVII